MGKQALIKRGSRKDRENDVLFGLVDLYVREGKPIGSNTLKESGFEHLSSATIRNYFARLEMEGYLKQHHASGGRVPTDKAYRLYAEEMKSLSEISKEDDLFLKSLLSKETKEISSYLQKSVEALSEMTSLAAFIAAPRFDQDFIIEMKLLKLDEERLVCALLTDFSLVHTEVIYLPEGMRHLSVEIIEDYFHFRLTNLDRPNLSEKEELFLRHTYNEIVLKHFVSYTNIHFEDIYKGGFSKLLLHTEFHDPLTLSNTLSLFENTESLRLILNRAYTAEEATFWVGSDLKTILPTPHVSMIIAIPYQIHNKIVGAVALLGPDRVCYKTLFGILEHFSKYLSENLTKTLYKFKLSYREPSSRAIETKYKSAGAIGLGTPFLIESKDERDDE